MTPFAPTQGFLLIFDPLQQFLLLIKLETEKIQNQIPYLVLGKGLQQSLPLLRVLLPI